MATVRKQLVTLLKPSFPKGWRVIDDERSIDKLTTTAVLIRQRTIARPTEVPLGAHRVTFMMTIIDPAGALAAAENSLDDDVDTLLHILDETHNLSWSTATKVTFNDRYLAYDIELDVLSRKE